MKKTQKSFRKKALLSSLSMLMVATVAVGSATFAWFTSDPNATASGLQLKATASKGLEIQTATHANVNSSFWGHTDYLNCNTSEDGSKTDSISLTPVSFDLSGYNADVLTAPATTTSTLGSYYSVEAAGDGASTAKSDGIVSKNPTGYIYSEDIKCRLTGVANESDTADLKINSLAITTKNVPQKAGIRVAISYNGKLIAVVAPAESTNNYLSENEGKGFTADTTTFADMDKAEYTYPICTSLNGTVIGKVGTAETDVVNVKVYLDGENSTVFSKNIAADDIVTSITLALKAE